MPPSLSAPLTHLRYLYPGNRFFVGLGTVVLLSAVGFWYAAVFWIAVAVLLTLVILLVADGARLYRAARSVTAVRRPPKIFSLGDTLAVEVLVDNSGRLPLAVSLTDELPAQLQVRDHRIDFAVGPGQKRTVAYDVTPLSRGAYGFGNINLFLRTGWRLAERRLIVTHAQTVAVYPSIVQMKSFALRADTSVPSAGKRRQRRLAKSYEFDQIKEYVRGDDFRSINWKATGRRAELMVNEYEEERAQRIYSVIDKGRTMLMPFGGLSLLDYSINAALALSNVILKRRDRAGLITFSDKLGDVLTADSKPDQLRRILETLYRQEEREGESDYDLLYYASRRFAGSRSLFLLFTNFESNYALDRVLPVLMRMNRVHQIVVVLFENTEIADLLTEPTRNTEEVYLKNTARRYLQERQLMAARLRRSGIHVVLTRPEALTGSVINKYLEMKGSGTV